MALNDDGKKDDENWDFLEEADDDQGENETGKDSQADVDDAFGKQEQDIITDPMEAHEARVRPSPCLPTKAEIEKHNATHYPYRSWCKVCVEAKAREAPHWRKGPGGMDKESGLPTVSMDYELLEEKITTLVVKDDQTGCILCYDCECKGPKDSWVIKQLVRDLDDWGRHDVCLKTDGEPSMIAMHAAVAAARTGSTIRRNPPAYNPQSNGAAEKAVQDVTAHMRVLLLALEARVKQKIDVTLPIIKWLIRHAAFLHTRYSMGHDGLTPWRRLTGRSWTGAVVEFGERVMGKLALKKVSTVKKSKRGKRKLAARSVEGIYVGVYPRTGEHIICKLDGEAIRVRTVNRLPVEDRWHVDKIVGVRALPRKPNPNTDKEVDIEGKLHADEKATKMESGEPVPQDEQQHVPDHTGSRELRINDRILEKFGFTPGCPGCIHKQLDLDGHRAHNNVCRARIYEAMSKDDDELERLKTNQQKLGKVPPKEEQIRRPTAPDAEVPPRQDAAETKRPDPSHSGVDPDTNPGGKRADPAHEGVGPGGVQPKGGERDNPVIEPGDHEGHGEDADTDDGLDPPQNADLDPDDDDIQMGLFGPDSDDDEAANADVADVTPAGPEKAEDDDDANVKVPEPKRQRKNTMALNSLSTLNTILEKHDVKQILKDIEKLAEFKMPNHRQRRTLRQNGYGKDVAEVYSPPRVTKVASSMKIRPAFALDLTQVDPEDGLPWDFSVEAKRRRCKEKIEADKPLMTIVCPMCGPFSLLMTWNYARKSKEETTAMLKAAMEHLKFALEICVMQYEAGRLFLFEHPVGARSWGTEMVQTVMHLEGVYLAKFDFCQLGMETLDEHGEAAAAKKRTGVLTNSKNIAEALRVAQCTGAHRHVPLLNGKAGPCQKYPDKFVKLICAGIKKEISDIRWRDRTLKNLDITQAMNLLMETTEKLEQATGSEQATAGLRSFAEGREIAVPPHEEDGEAEMYENLYHGKEFCDDISGAPLDKALAILARRTEIEFFKKRGVYTKVRREKGMQVISTKWIDQNKGDAASPNYRARLVGREIAREKSLDLFAATPPLESLRAIISLCSSRQRRRQPHRIMSIDVKRAYFYAEATRPIYIAIPDEDKEEGDQDRVAKLNLSLYGTRDAAMNWAATYTKHLKDLGFLVGKGSPCNFHHRGGTLPLPSMATTSHAPALRLT